MKSRSFISALTTPVMTACFLPMGCMAETATQENEAVVEVSAKAGAGLVWAPYDAPELCSDSCRRGTFNGLCCVRNTCPTNPAGQECSRLGAFCVSVRGEKTFQRFVCAAGL